MKKKLLSVYTELLVLIGVIIYIYFNPHTVDTFLDFFRKSPIKLESFIAAMILFFSLLYLLRFFKSLLAKYIIGPLKIETGLKNSIVSIIGYISLFIILMITTSILGLKLEKLGWVLGGLSVGIGFGMQNVINNFISGIIILVSRPLKIGDRVILNGKEGIVKKINIRATELETFTKTTVLVPNADILSNDLVNYTHHDCITRTDITVGVSYDSDPHQVREILLDVAARDPRVLRNPAPLALFTEFGDNSLNFELRIFSDTDALPLLKSDLTFAVFDAFARAKIEIPLPQRVVHFAQQSAPKPARKRSAKKQH